MNTKAKGEKAQLVVIGEFAKLDIPVLIPLTDNLPFDFVALINNKLIKIQVKSSEQKIRHGARGFKIRTSNWYKKTTKSYSEQDCDFIVCYDTEFGYLYLLEPKHFVGVKNFFIRKEKPKNNQSKKINMHNDFILTKEKLNNLC